MKIAEGFKLRPLGREFVVMAENMRQMNFNKMIALNSTAAFLWQNVMGKEFTVQDLSDLLVGEYEVDRQTADKDSAAIAQKWIEAGIVVE